jgi:hypothetical protein
VIGRATQKTQPRDIKVKVRVTGHITPIAILRLGGKFLPAGFAQGNTRPRSSKREREGDARSAGAYNAYIISFFATKGAVKAHHVEEHQKSSLFNIQRSATKFRFGGRKGGRSAASEKVAYRYVKRWRRFMSSSEGAHAANVRKRDVEGCGRWYWRLERPALVVVAQLQERTSLAETGASSRPATISLRPCSKLTFGDTPSRLFIRSVQPNEWRMSPVRASA